MISSGMCLLIVISAGMCRLIVMSAALCLLIPLFLHAVIICVF